AACCSAAPPGSSPPCSSAVISNGISSSANAAARFWMSRSESVSPYMDRSSWARGPAVSTILTDCSVYASIGLVPMPWPPDTADAVVVGGGTIGAWCAYFLRQAGLERGVLGGNGVLGQGASSRAAGVVRLQG